MNNCDLSKVFLEGEILTSYSGLMYLKPYKVGELVLTSGKLVACDPLVFAGTEPFKANLAPGSYPVILSLAYKQDEKYPKAEAVSNFTVFNIKGNTYRLIADIRYLEQIIYIKYILTDAEYDKENWKDDPYF